MSDDPKDRGDPRDDPAHQTMPPELRPFAKPVPVQRLVAPEDEASFRADIEALKLLNGGPTADPFYVDPRKDPAFAGRQAPDSVRAFATATLPAAEAAVRLAAPARVVIADAKPPSALSEPAGEVDVRPFQGVLRAGQRAAPAQGAVEDRARVAQGRDETPEEPAPSVRPEPPESAATPWEKETLAEDGETTRPSSRRPRDVPPSEEAVAMTQTARSKAVLFVALVVLVAGGLMWAFVQRLPPDTGGHGPMPTATTAAPVVPTTPPPAPSATPEPVRAVPTSSSPQASPSTAPSSTPAPPAPHPSSKHRPKVDDPYVDAAVAPSPPVTAAPSAVPPPPPAVATGHPAAPTASSPQPPQPPPIPKIIEGTEP